MHTTSLPPVTTALGGGFYAGRILIAGVAYALIAAPKAEGETLLPWIHEEAGELDIPGARSYCDGMANTVAMAEAGSALGHWARGLQIGGFTDWHVPARDQLELLYRAFKPTTQTNYVYRSGDNPSSLPAGYPYTEAEPAQAAVAAFQKGGAEAFEAAWYWSSTQHSAAAYAWNQYFDNGLQHCNDKGYEARARAVRLIQLTA